MKKLLVIIILIIGIGAGGFMYAKDKVSSLVSDKVIENSVKSIAARYGVSEEKVDEVLNQVSDEDKETVKRIINDNVDFTTVTTLVSGDKEDAIEYVEEHLNEDEKETLQNLYNKYAGLLK